MSVAVGQKVKVKSANGLFIQEGTVTKLLPDGGFKFKNSANFERSAKARDLVPMSTPTGDAKVSKDRAKTRDYLKAWAAEDGKGDD